MTEKYTLEEIEAAIRRIFTLDESGRISRAVIAELTRSNDFRDGEILIKKNNEFGCIKVREGGGMKYLNYRPLRLSEMPRAVEDLRKYVQSRIGKQEGAAAALAAFDERVKP